jgi:hypothetical protein
MKAAPHKWGPDTFELYRVARRAGEVRMVRKLLLIGMLVDKNSTASQEYRTSRAAPGGGPSHPAVA